MSQADGSDVDVSVLPTGTVTLLLADVEGSTRLWQTRSEEMSAAIALLDRTLADVVAAHGGVRPVEQGEGDSFVVAFARASDAVACALTLQASDLSPIRLRIGVHTGEVRLRDEGNYIGPTINRTARLRDLAHGGQTVLSSTAGDLVIDELPDGAWLTDLGVHALRDLPRPERVVQLCHPDLCNEFPPLRVANPVAAHGFPVQLTSFVGREAGLAQLRELLADNRLVTLTGAGGVGKTRLAVQIAGELVDEYGGGAWYVDLAPITHPDLVPVTVARALGLPDQAGRTTLDNLLRFIADRRMLTVLDNCEHLLDPCAALATTLLGGCRGLTLMATSREPIGVTGEVVWRVPSLSLSDEAVELFTDRARRVRPDFTGSGDNSAVVAEICARLDGLPLAIELAAARVRALSLAEILDGLHDRFRLLTGGSRIAVRRQQTLLASVDWSHNLLTEPERILFRRLAVFLGGFDLEAAQVIGGGDDVARYQVVDLLTLLVDKSLLVAVDSTGRTRYRLLETVRQYALQKLGESGEADAVHARHRDHYTALVAPLDAPARTDYEQRLARADIEIDNLRAAFGWSYENGDLESALMLASSLQPLFLTRGRIREGMAWFDTILTAASEHDLDLDRALYARVLADRSLLAAGVGAADCVDHAQQALALAREIDDPALLARALTACGYATAINAETAESYFIEAIDLARAVDDRWRLSYIFGWQANAAIVAGDPMAARAAAEDGLALAEMLGACPDLRRCRYCLGTGQLFQGELSAAVAQFDAVAAEAEAAHDQLHWGLSLGQRAYALAYRGDIDAAREAAERALEIAAEFGAGFAGFAQLARAVVALAAGDVTVAADASEAARRALSFVPGLSGTQAAFNAQAALAARDLGEARRRADTAVATTTGFYRILALTTRSWVAIAQGDAEPADRDAHESLKLCVELQSYLGISDILECFATLAVRSGSHHEAARLFGAADAARQRIGVVRFKIFDAGYGDSVAAARDALGGKEFDDAWAEGAALTTEEAIACAQRGRGGRKRPASGWDSLTPAELDVARLVSEGLGNKDVAARLFVSPRTVQAHLAHVYTKLGVSSRVQLAQQVAQHS